MIYEFSYNKFTTYSDLIDKVSNVHKQLFVNANGTSQCAKYEEEFIEFVNTKNDKEIMQELADLFIVACGIRNFYSAVGNSILGYLVNKIKDSSDQVQQIFVEEVCNKMNENQKRKWNETTNGYYKHELSNSGE